jgi:hypothetical protein
MERELVVVLHMRLPSRANLRLHWARAARLAREQRQTAYWQVRAALAANPKSAARIALPISARLIRLAPRRLDDDNLAAAFKHVRDGTASALGLRDDGHLSGRFACEQRITPAAESRVEVRIRLKQ